MYAIFKIARQNYIALYIRLHRRLICNTTQMVLKSNLPGNAYKPDIVEKNKYEKWEAYGLFKAEVPKPGLDKPVFSMVLPPPNVTGKLHLGHALTCTVQDVIVRRKRSMGHNVLWLPGTDHAGIATQNVVEQYLKTKSNMTRHQLGREKFIKEVLKWREKHGDTIGQQLRKLGCSLDWSRETFTMDPNHTQAVNTAFITLFKKGLIYRKKALVNWCNALKSTVSDIEVENISMSGPTEIKVPGYDRPIKFGLLYDFAYPIIGNNKEIVVSTTMPETMLGDTAIAVNPNDERYKHLIGKQATHPFRNKAIPIIADEFVDMKLGTGAVKITPAHSKVDYAIAKKHNLPSYEVINEDGLMKNSGNFDNLKKYDCRDKVLKKLKGLNLLRDISAHPMTLPICSRSGDVIEYILKEQWFLRCSKLNVKAADLVRLGQLKIDPEKFNSYWYNWTGDDRDWCISRQLWWGHQAPAYKCTAEDHTVWVAATDAQSAKEYASKVLRSMPEQISTVRDTDVLDTWFSSGLYPFAALGWPEQTPIDKTSRNDFKTFYPLNLLATGHDILGFWVHRMVILGLELTGRLPFNNILLHGIICDSTGVKMSKSRGNVIDPMDIINGITIKELKAKSEQMHRDGVLNNNELQNALAYHKSNFSTTNGIPQCGADALRFTLLSHDIKSHYINFDVAMCNANKLFCNKIWQSVRYMQIQFAKLRIIEGTITRKDLTIFDRWILSRLADMVGKVNTAMDDNDFHLATKALRTFIYNEFCDVYLEATKSGFDDGNVKTSFAHAHTLNAVLNTSLRCLAPYMVYLTEEIIPKLPSFQLNIIYNFSDHSKKYFDFPTYNDFEEWKDENTEERIGLLLNCVQLVRELKGLYGMSNQLRPAVIIKTSDTALIQNISENTTIFKHLTRTIDLAFNVNDSRKYASSVLNADTEVFVEIIGKDADSTILSARDKMKKRINKIEDTLIKLEAKLSSSNYIRSAPEWTQLIEREKLHTKKKELEKLQRLVPDKL